jgi:hypothetical protein
VISAPCGREYNARFGRRARGAALARDAAQAASCSEPRWKGAARDGREDFVCRAGKFADLFCRGATEPVKDFYFMRRLF